MLRTALNLASLKQTQRQASAKQYTEHSDVERSRLSRMFSTEPSSPAFQFSSNKSGMLLSAAFAPFSIPHSVPLAISCCYAPPRQTNQIINESLRGRLGERAKSDRKIKCRRIVARGYRAETIQFATNAYTFLALGYVHVLLLK